MESPFSRGDLTDPGFLESVVAGQEAVVSCVAGLACRTTSDVDEWTTTRTGTSGTALRTDIDRPACRCRRVHVKVRDATRFIHRAHCVAWVVTKKNGQAVMAWPLVDG